MDTSVSLWAVCTGMGLGCVLFHVVALIFLATVARWIRRKLELSNRNVARNLHKLAVELTFVCLAIGLLHFLETLACAAIFVAVGALGSFDDALFFSMDTMATRGASSLTLAESWRMLGAVEAACGVLLFGMSTAFLFAVMQTSFGVLLRTFDTNTR